MSNQNPPKCPLCREGTLLFSGQDKWLCDKCGATFSDATTTITKELGKPEAIPCETYKTLDEALSDPLFRKQLEDEYGFTSPKEPERIPFLVTFTNLNDPLETEVHSVLATDPLTAILIASRDELAPNGRRLYWQDLSPDPLTEEILRELFLDHSETIATAIPLCGGPFEGATFPNFPTME